MKKHSLKETEAELAQKKDDSPDEEYDASELETEIPLRRKKKPAGKKRKKKKDLLFSERKFRERRGFFARIMGNEDAIIKPLTVFGVRITYWPFILVLALILVVGILFVKNSDIQTIQDNITIVGLPDDLEKYGILVISDMNSKRFGDDQTSLVRSIEATDYKIILCVGDMVGKSGDPEPFYDLLDSLSHPERVYFVCGDADPGPFVKTARDIEGTLDQIVLEDWILGAMDRGATYVDSPTKLAVGASKIWLIPDSLFNVNASEYRELWKDQTTQEEDGVISGLSSDYATLPFTAYRTRIAQKLYDTIGVISSDDIIISMSHVPPTDSYIHSANMHISNGEAKYLPGPDLIVSGHYCGGVWQIPFAGALYLPDSQLPRNGWFPKKEYVKGARKIGESTLYVSGGLSTTSVIPLLKFRLFNEPEINLLKLTAKLPDNMLYA